MENVGKKISIAQLSCFVSRKITLWIWHISCGFQQCSSPFHMNCSHLTITLFLSYYEVCEITTVIIVCFCSHKPWSLEERDSILTIILVSNGQLLNSCSLHIRKYCSNPVLFFCLFLIFWINYIWTSKPQQNVIVSFFSYWFSFLSNCKKLH